MRTGTTKSCHQRGVSGSINSLWATLLIAGLLLTATRTYAGPGGASQVSLQGHTLTASHTLKVKVHVEDAAIEITRMVFELAKEYASATSISVQVRIDLSGADDRSVSSRGTVDFDRLDITDLAQVRQCSSYQELLYNSYVWLPSRLQMRLDQLLKHGTGA